MFFHIIILIGILNIYSSGNNTIKNTNNQKTVLINDLSFKSNDYISNLGFKNNYQVYFKNLNTVAKNDSVYKNTPQISFANIFEFSSSLPLTKTDLLSNNTITPKISLRVNPGNMKDQSSLNRRISTGNIFNINRLGISDSFESGQSLTFGINYKRELINKNRSYDYTIATVLRDKYNDKIPQSSTINEKKSNIYGTFNNNLSENFSLNYNFSIDNNLDKLHYNSVATTLSINNFVTTFNFVEENSLIGDTNTISNNTSYNFNENNFVRFKTRRNRKINLTEFYDLIYEYKNDCLTAGIKYRKTYYQDRELKPTEDLLLTLTLIPLTTYEQKIDR
jgi:LPS-assembly protein